MSQRLLADDPTISAEEWYRRMVESEGTQRRRYVETRSIQELRDARGDRCRRCGSRSKLEFAHVKETSVRGRGRGQMVRYCDIKRNPGSYELLCWHCHHEFDRKGGYRVFFGLLLVEWLNQVRGDRGEITDEKRDQSDETEASVCASSAA